MQTSPSTSIQPTIEINAVETGVRIVAISANSNRNLAVDDQGRVWERGTYQEAPCNSPCQGEPDCKLRPSLVPGLTDVVSITAGYDHNLALKRDGTVWGWGKNDIFQLGQGQQDTRSKYYATPLQVPGFDHVIAISASSGFSLALKEDGGVWAWGHSPSGELGDGNDSYTPKYSLHEETPFQVVNLGNVTAIDTGVDHSIALRSDGSVWTWGNNQLGTLGVGSADTEQHPIPVQVTNLTDVVVLGSGFANNSVIKKGGTVWIWGGNFGMQLCQGTMDFDPHAEPSQIQAFSCALAVDNSSTQTIAMMDGETVWICGMMENGISSITEMRIPVLSSILAISAGEDHVIA